MRRLIMSKLFIPIVLLVFVQSISFAGFHADTSWDVRATGNDANGGGFQVGATGTDRSQSDGPYQVYTDILINATTTRGSSVLFPFDATTVNNIINITGGVGCTVQRIQAVSNAAGLITFDKSLGAAGSTCTGNLGGSLLTPATAAALVVNGNKVHVQTGTYTNTATVTITSQRQTWIGYNGAHEDFGTKPLITTATDNTPLFTGTAGGSSVFLNLSLSNTAAVRAAGILNSNGGALVVHDCLFDGFSLGVNGDSQWSQATITYSEIKNSTSHGFRNDAATVVSDSYIHDNGGYGVYAGATGVSTSITSSVITNNTAGGIYNQSYPLLVKESTIAGNGGDGITDGQTSASRMGHYENNILYNNGGWGIGIDSATPPWVWTSWYNALGANTRGDYGRTATATVYTPTRVAGQVTLSADPFTSSAGGDYSLNATAGGGEACKGTGFPGAFVGGTTTGYLDIGAVQTAAGPGATAHGSAFVQ